MYLFLSLIATLAKEKATEVAEGSGFLQTLFETLFDADWNREHAVYIWPLIFVTLVLTGIGLPTPEDIWLTLAGFSAYKQAGDKFVWYYFVGIFFLCSTANLIGDSFGYLLGRRYGFTIRDRFKFTRAILTEKRIRKVQGWFDNYGNWTVFLGRQMAGVRFVTFFSAGTMRMPMHKFLLFDFLGCLVSLPVWFTLGALAAIYGQEWLEVASRRAGGGIFIAAGIAIVVFILVIKYRAAKRGKREAQEMEKEILLSTRTLSTEEIDGELKKQ
jgi:membrane protein DedA with SNARE-associated domain